MDARTKAHVFPILDEGSDENNCNPPNQGATPRTCPDPCAMPGFGKRMEDDQVPEWSTEYVPYKACLLYTSPSPRDKRQSRMPSSA